MLFGSLFLEDFWHEVEEHAAIVVRSLLDLSWLSIPCWLSFDWYKNSSHPNMEFVRKSGSVTCMENICIVKLSFIPTKCRRAIHLHFCVLFMTSLCGSFFLCLARRVSALEPGNLIMLSLRLECTRWSPILSANCSSFKHSITWNKKFLRRKPNKLLEIGRLGNRQLTKWFTGARINGDGRGLVFRTQQRLSRIMNRWLWHGTPTFQSVLTVEFLVQIA